MNLLPTEEQTQIIDSVRRFLAQALPLERLRDDRRPAVTEAQWRTAAELGLFGIGLPQAQGGVGCGPVEEVLVMRELGRVVASPSFMATALAAQLAQAGGHAELAGALLQGGRRAHLVIAPQAPETRPCRALRVDGTEGEPMVALWPQGIGLALQGFVPEGEAASLDESVALQAGTLQPGKAPEACAVPPGILLRASLMLAAQLVGLAERARDMAVSHAQVRRQFGQAIGAFQAVKHRCADMAVQAEVAWAQVLVAAHAVALAQDDAAAAVGAARWLAATAAHRNADGAIQVHGGIGFQAECDVHHLMKRAHLFDQAGGSRRWQATALAAA